jgi:hypothetical protein
MVPVSFRHCALHNYREPDLVQCITMRNCIHVCVGCHAHPGKWSFSAACTEAWASNGAFADVVEEFIAGTDPELASATELLLEAVCE